MGRERKANRRLGAADCEIWNEKHPVGTDVSVVKDDGTPFISRTDSEAYMLSGHTAVIHVAGISGCYLLDRVTAIPTT